MSEIIEGFKFKFANLKIKIELKQHSIKDSFQREIKALNDKYNEKNLEEKYSKELNLYRDGLLKQISTNLRLEIDQANIEKKQIKNLEYKSAKTCIGQLIKKEFNFNKIFSISKLVKYKKFLGLEEVIETSDESNDKNILLEAISLASQFGNLEIVKYLVEYAANVNAKEVYCDGTAIQYASINGHLEIVKYLVKNGADVNAQENDDDSCKYFIETESVVNAKKKYGKTALIYASREGHFEIVRYLVENGADVNANDDVCRTALKYASLYGHLEMVKYLVEHGADVNARDKWKNTALALASKNGHLEIVKYLIEYRADRNVKNKYNETALTAASSRGHLDIVKYLIKNGADV